MLTMTMTKNAASEDEAVQQTTAELVFLDENNRPTPLLVGCVILELAWDATVAYLFYRWMKNRK